MIQQTGFLYKLNPTDYRTGASPIVWDEINLLGDWRTSLPLEEKQHNFSFDTISCTTFSALNVIETFINHLMYNDKLTLSQLEFLNQNGYIVNGKANFSDRFTAIMSGTTPEGNYFQNVLDSIRKDGLLPEKDFPFAGSTWAEYHDKTKITEAMKVKAKKILEVFDFFYEWVEITNTQQELFNAFKQSPVQVAVTKEVPQHAIMLPKMDWEFETYVPYLRPRNRSIAYAMKIKVSPKSVQGYKYFSKAEVDKWKLKPEMWQLLDKIRGECGFAFNITSGLRTKEENDSLKDSVSDSAHLSGLAVDIACTESSKRFKMIDVAIKNGIKRIGVGKTFVHLDIDPTKPQEVIWLYN